MERLIGEPVEDVRESNERIIMEERFCEDNKYNTIQWSYEERCVCCTEPTLLPIKR